MLKYKKVQQLLKNLKLSTVLPIIGLVVTLSIILTPVVAAAATYACGSGKERVETSIDFGCYGSQCGKAGASSFCSADHNGVVDILFAIIRFLSAGVGLVVIGSIVWAGIQYTTSRGDPQASAAAIKRIRNTVIALAIYIFAYAILNYLIPKGFFV
jgi:hypothetical protein